MIAINMPPLTGPEAGVPGLIEVVLDKPQSSSFTRFFGGAPGFVQELLGIFWDPPTVIQTPAISQIRSTGEHCELALDTATETPVDQRGMAALSVQASSSGEHSRLIVDGIKTVTLDPGRYRGGLWFTDDARVSLNPGLYIIDGGDLLIDGRSTVVGVGVSFVLTAIDPLNIGNLKIAGTGKVDLRAWNDDTSPYAGLLFHQDSRLIPPEPWHGIVRDWLLAAAGEGWRELRRLAATLSQPDSVPANQGIGAKLGRTILVLARLGATAASVAKLKLGRSLIPKTDDRGAVEDAQSTPTAATESTVSPVPAAPTETDRGAAETNSALDLTRLSRGELEALETLVTNSGDPATGTDPARTNQAA